MSAEKLHFVYAESGVRQLQARCIDSIWRKDYVTFGQCFAPDGEWRIAGQVLRGPTECSAFVGRIMPGMNRVMMAMHTPILKLTQDGAIGRTYMTEMVSPKEGVPRFPIGIYFDRFVERGGTWLYASHHYQSYYSGPVDLSGRFAEFTDYGAPFGMPAPDDTAPPTLAAIWTS